MTASLSVIIPIAPNDSAWIALLPCLAHLPANTEIIAVSSAEINADIACQKLPSHSLTLLRTESGRAQALNAGAKAATGDFLWFVHADSLVSAESIAALIRATTTYQQHLLYFDLRFKGGSPLMFLNEWGVWLRSHLFNTPFGDQGFCLQRTLFERLDGFDEQADYGEDHLLVWKARQHGIKLRSTGETIVTSARKYRAGGWLNTTTLHLSLWLKQAWPQWKVLRQIRREQPKQDQ